MGKELKMSKNHITLSFPRDLKDEVKKFLERPDVTGYRNATEFIIEAVRLRLEDMKNQLNTDQELKSHINDIVEMVFERMKQNQQNRH